MRTKLINVQRLVHFNIVMVVILGQINTGLQKVAISTEPVQNECKDYNLCEFVVCDGNIYISLKKPQQIAQVMFEGAHGIT